MASVTHSKGGPFQPLTFKDLSAGMIFRSVHPSYPDWFMKTSGGDRVHLGTGKLVSQGFEDRVQILDPDDKIILQNTRP